MIDELGASGLRFERNGPIAWCTIDRPEARNALTPAMYFGIRRAVSLVNRDPELAALIITGTGDVFAPGGFITGAYQGGGTATYSGTSQASPHVAGFAVLAQQLAERELGRWLTPAEYRQLLQSTGTTIVDGDDENDNVVNTGASFSRLDAWQLADAILALSTNNSFYSVTLGEGTAITGRDFGNRTFVPSVADVRVGGTTWPVAFADGVSIPAGSAAQLAPLPWTTIDQLHIVFTEDVTVAIKDLNITGVGAPDVLPKGLGGFAYDSATFTATWTFAEPATAAALTIELSDNVFNSAGDRLDGDWNNASDVFPSGDSTAGGDFHFQWNMLPGDANQSATVDGLDFLAWAGDFEQPLGGQLAPDDFNTDGVVDGLDYFVWAGAFGDSLPAGATSPSAASTPATVVVSNTGTDTVTESDAYFTRLGQSGNAAAVYEPRVLREALAWRRLTDAALEDDHAVFEETDDDESVGLPRPRRYAKRMAAG
jgi:hypothetical protein